MTKKVIYTSVAFIGVFLLHGAYLLWRAGKWASIGSESLLSRYLAEQDYFMGLSYGLAAAFTVYSFMRFTGGQRSGLGGAIGGLTVTGYSISAGVSCLDAAAHPCSRSMLAFSVHPMQASQSHSC